MTHFQKHRRILPLDLMNKRGYITPVTKIQPSSFSQVQPTSHSTRQATSFYAQTQVVVRCWVGRTSICDSTAAQAAVGSKTTGKPNTGILQNEQVPPLKRTACVSWSGVHPVCIKSHQLEDTNNLHSVDLTQVKAIMIPDQNTLMDTFPNTILPPCPERGSMNLKLLWHRALLQRCWAVGLVVAVAQATSTFCSFHTVSHRRRTYTQGDVKLFGRLQD